MKTPNTSRYAHLLCLVMPLACLAGTALADGGTDILTSSQHRKKNADITLTYDSYLGFDRDDPS